MELDELEKRVDWLDSERQKSNSLINEFKDQIVSLESVIEKQKEKIVILEGDLKNIPAMSNRVAQFDDVFSHLKVDYSKLIADLEKKHAAQIKSLEKQQRDDVSLFNKKIAEVQ